MTTRRIVELAARIQQSTSEIDSYLQKNQLPSPSFDEDAVADSNLSSGDISVVRDQVLEATLELHDLLLGPALCLRPTLNGVSLQAIYKYDIASKVPLHGEISFADLAEKCGLSEVNVRRLLRFAMIFYRAFREPRRGYVAHTAASRRLLEDPHARHALGYQYEEVWQSFAHTVTAMEEFRSDEPNKTGWHHFHNTDKSTWNYYASHPEMALRFAGAMSAFANGQDSGASPSYLLQSDVWERIGKATVVDVGGSQGDVSILLAEKYPELRFIVQDLPEAFAKAAESPLPADIQDRVEFQPYDFFTEQPVQADVYLFRQIFHDWSDSNSVRILKSLIPALRPGARIVINDWILPEPGAMSFMKERNVRSMDVIMLSLFNSREREKGDWLDLLETADPRFTSNVKIWTPEGTTMGIIDILWPGSSE